MSMADKIMANAQPHLDAGEQVQGGFAGQSRLVARAGDGGYRVVVATDRRFLIFQSGMVSQTSIKSLIAATPRGQRLGEPKGLFYDVTVGEETMKVNKRYFKQIRAIDQAAA